MAIRKQLKLGFSRSLHKINYQKYITEICMLRISQGYYTFNLLAYVEIIGISHLLPAAANISPIIIKTT